MASHSPNELFSLSLRLSVWVILGTCLYGGTAVIIEPHIHMYSRTTDDYQAMYGAGIRVCVAKSYWGTDTGRA